MDFENKNKRNKFKPRTLIYLKIFPPFFLIFFILIALPLYTPWVFNKNMKALKEWFPNPYNFVLQNKIRILNENIASATNVLLAKEPKIFSSIKTLKIWIEDGGLEKMNYELLNFNLFLRKNKPKVKGFFKGFNEKTYGARVNIRGTRPNHQMVWKPSLKIRLKNKKLYEGFRDQVLISPEDVIGLRNWISANLGYKWGLLNNLEGFVRLYINNKNYGLYNKVSPFNESLLIHSRRLPGPFLNFNFYRKNYFYIWKKQWYEPSAWKVTEKKYSSKKNLILPPINISQGILRWKNDIDSINFLESVIRLNHYISSEQFAKFLAILTHGGEKHYVDNHNALFWFNPTLGLLEPIINDQNGYGLTNKKEWIKDSIIKNEGAFVKAWFKNPLNQAIYVEKLNNLVNSIGNKKSMEKMIRNQWKEIRSVLQSETFLSQACFPARCFFPIHKLDDEIDKLIVDIKLRIDWIRKELDNVNVYLIGKNKEGFEILVMGFSGIETQRKDGKIFYLKFKEFKVGIGQNFKNRLKKINGVKNIKLLPTISASNLIENIESHNSYSFYFLEGKPKDYVFFHRLSKQEIKINTSGKNFNLNIMKTFSGLNSLNFQEKNISPITFGPGKVFFKESKTFAPGQSVFIKPGTDIYLGKNVQLIFQGPLIMDGTHKNPVNIQPIESKAPFGVIALLGKKTTGSKINFLNLKGGSVGKHYNLSFSGMLSVHDCPDIQITNSNFGKNYIGDDAVHIINSKVSIKNSTFKDSKYDALDLDSVDGKLINNHFLNPGNDAVDLSMGNTIIIKNRFIGCMDKCISVGENAKTKIKNSYFQNCNIAIAVKDKSFAILKNSLIDSCNVGWSSYRKKWRWEMGGQGKIINSDFINSKKSAISGDKFSSVNYLGNNLEKMKVNGEIDLRIKQKQSIFE